MACGCTTNDSFAKCAGFPTFHSDIEGPNGEWAAHYAQLVGAPATGRDNATNCSPWFLCVNVIMCHRLPYYADNPGDCAKDTKVDIKGAGLSKGLSIGGTAAGTFGGIAGLATGTASSIGDGLAAGGLAAAGSIATIAAFGVGLLLIPLAFIGHHSAEVAIEKKVLCSVASGYNNFADQVEQMLSSGQLTARQANDMADQIQQQIVNALQTGYKNCNARCFYTYAIKALTLFCKERLYPKLEADATQKAIASTSAVASPSSTKNIAIGIGLAAIALLAKILL